MQELSFLVSENVGKVSALLVRPQRPKALLALAHGAGAGMRHKFMDAAAEKLANAGVATLRYQFPYMEKSIKRPDSEKVLTETIRAAVAVANNHAAGVPVFWAVASVVLGAGIAAFAIIRAMSTRNGDPEHACRPFDAPPQPRRRSRRGVPSVRRDRGRLRPELRARPLRAALRAFRAAMKSPLNAAASRSVAPHPAAAQRAVSAY